MGPPTPWLGSAASRLFLMSSSRRKKGRHFTQGNNSFHFF
jgi:hypothetical protein